MAHEKFWELIWEQPFPACQSWKQEKTNRLFPIRKADETTASVVAFTKRGERLVGSLPNDSP